jgi:hypothetical protein
MFALAHAAIKVGIEKRVYQPAFSRRFTIKTNVPSMTAA